MLILNLQSETQAHACNVIYGTCMLAICEEHNISLPIATMQVI